MVTAPERKLYTYTVLCTKHGFEMKRRDIKDGWKYSCTCVT